MGNLSMPQRHPRVLLVSEAESALMDRVLKWRRKDASKLTTWEIASVLASVLAGQLSGLSKYEIRHERHGNYDTPGDWSSDE